MIFGEAVELPATVAAAEWIAGSCRGTWWTVGALVPNQYPSILRVRAPEPSVEDWWAAYRDLFETIATVGARHTSTAGRAWFAVWEGHGFANATTHVAWRGPLDEATRAALDLERSRLRAEDERRNGAIRAALREVPRFALPHRVYHLLAGPVTAAARLQEPGAPDRWRRPELWWPDDRCWFVATDVDFWSVFVGGDHDLVAELADRVPTDAEIVPLDQPLEAED
jgi:hypothetical protein